MYINPINLPDPNFASRYLVKIKERKLQSIKLIL